ncbi:MAG: cbb3-type cytochrome c oxidase subunit I [Bdellovibrionales bacterium]|nr:cbb3-type cytochrome c oxidase subunit I [Bdellovibrionales bacterium]
MTTEKQNLAQILLNKKYWIIHFLFVTAISVAGLIYLGHATYDAAPPLASIVDTSGNVVISRESIDKGQQVFLQRGLMNYGTFWGDGSERGPDFTADALRRVTESMQRFYRAKASSEGERAGGPARVLREQRANGWNGQEIAINGAQIHAWNEFRDHVRRMFRDPSYPDHIRLGHVINDSDLDALAGFFFWGSWVTVANRPGETYSYTHNWPYYPEAGNNPTPETVLWSVISVLVLFLGIGLVLYAYGQMKVIYPEPFSDTGNFLTTGDLENGVIRPTQPGTYRFFALAMALFGLQIVAGILCATDFVRPFGIYLGDIIPFSVARSYHTLFQIFWFFMCWVGYTIFFLPRLAPVPPGQRGLINLLFWLCMLVGAGALIGIYLGQKGIVTGEAAYWVGSQGWEFMELGRLFQILLLAAFALWIFIIYRAVKPWLTKKNLWSVPSWLLYGSGVMVFFLFFGLFVTPKSNFAVADYWRWMVVHMWVEVTFEVFTTVIVAYIMVQMNFINRVMAERAIFLAVMMFLFTATIGIAHNFYWIAKPTGIIALGSVFSTTQVLPLLLLTLDAWSMRQKGIRAATLQTSGRQKVIMNEVWLYILAVNFWNVFGAGMFGSLINLPIVNYFEHATYLTNNHAHGAMFGVKGNIALGGMLFCLQHLFPRAQWNAKLLRTIFWSLNVGVAMMMFLDLFPVGVYQLMAVLQKGLWYARSKDLVEGSVFQTLTYLRSVGGVVFVLGGVIPLIWFVFSRKPQAETAVKETSWPQFEEGWSSQDRA